MTPQKEETVEQYAYYSALDWYLEIEHDFHTVTCIKLVSAPDFKHTFSPVSDLAARQLLEYFEGSRITFDFPITLRGTPFQLTVWKELCSIPYGETRTYSQIAAAIGNPKAVRAVGMACNRNPIWIAVPCHRVIGSNQKLTGYAGGLDTKQFLLNLERQK
jgi:O-6-methylguanine DNA methyltransferase